MLTEGFLFLGSANFCRKGTIGDTGSVAFSGCRKKERRKCNSPKKYLKTMKSKTGEVPGTYWTVINENK